jgi:uncharacterized protein YlbG (UPF0298 family)
LFIAACRKEQTDNPNETRISEAERVVFFNTLKNPEEVMRLVPGFTGFDASLLNDSKNFYLYATSEVMAAANVGVYMADLNYCMLFNKRDESETYVKTIYELSKVIQIEKSALEFILNRYEGNLAQQDSLKAMANQLFEKATVGLQGSTRERLAGIAMAGYQIENLYLALATLKSYPASLTEDQAKSKDQIVRFIVGQRVNIEIIYNFVRANSDPLDPDRNPNYPFFDHALRELIAVYNTVTENDLHQNELSEKVNALRNKIISTE